MMESSIYIAPDIPGGTKYPYLVRGKTTGTIFLILENRVAIVVHADEDKPVCSAYFGKVYFNFVEDENFYERLPPDSTVKLIQN